MSDDFFSRLDAINKNSGSHVSEPFSFNTEKIDGNTDKKREVEEDVRIAAAMHETARSVEDSSKRIAEEYKKDPKYNRANYDSNAKNKYKQEVFAKSKHPYFIDPDSGRRLYKTQKEAKEIYGEKWQDHVVEPDHIKSLKEIHETYGNDPFLTTEDLRKVANSKWNLRLTSRHANNAKRDRPIEDTLENEKWLKDNNIKVTKEGKKGIEIDKLKANVAIELQLTGKRTVNMARIGHSAGLESAQQAGTMTGCISGIENIVAVLKSEKSVEEALTDLPSDMLKASALSYMSGGVLAIVEQNFSNTSSEFMRSLLDAQVPAKIITCLTMTSKTIQRFLNGEITTSECIVDIGEKGLSMAAISEFMAMGSLAIPIPVVGAAIGAFFGSCVMKAVRLSDRFFGETRGYDNYQHKMYIEACERIVQEEKRYQQELEQYLDAYFKDYRLCFDRALVDMKKAFVSGDADGMIRGSNQIIRKLGGDVRFNNMSEFMDFLEDDSPFII